VWAVAELPDLRDHVRAELASSETVLVRGGPDSVTKLRTHAARARRAFVLDGGPVLGISVFAALDDVGPASLDGLLAGRLSTYRVVHVTSVGRLVAAGLSVLPTFGPHMTVLLTSLGRTDQLFDLLGPPQPNPGYGETRRRRRGDTR
jgi:hypothetical protein